MKLLRASILVGELDRAGIDIEEDLERALADMGGGPAALPHDHTVEINFEDPHRSSWDGRA